MHEGDEVMEQIYIDTAGMLKALSDPKRLKIIDMLSCGEICACNILGYFNITQPTLSHDMKVLMDAGIVQSRRQGKNVYYRLNEDRLALLQDQIHQLFGKKEQCICGQLDCGCRKEN